MINFNIRAQQPTDADLANEEAQQAYAIREAKKALARQALVGTAALVGITAGLVYLNKKLGKDADAEMIEETILPTE